MTAAPAAVRQERREPDLRVVRPRPRRRVLGYATLLVVLCSAGVFGTVALNALGAGDAVAARALEREVAEGERLYADLVAEVARLEDPGRIERIATEELGMTRPDEQRFVVVHRLLPTDVHGVIEVEVGDAADPLKPLLSSER